MLQHTATRCKTLQHPAIPCNTHYNTLKTSPIHTHERSGGEQISDRNTFCSTLQHTATHCNTLQHIETHFTLEYTALHCNINIIFTRTGDQETSGSVTRPRTATHCNTLQHTATHCNALQHTATHCNTLQHTATHCNTLQHMQHTALSYLHTWVIWRRADQ